MKCKIKTIQIINDGVPKQITKIIERIALMPQVIDPCENSL